jgi:hypothetical protein
MKFEDVQATFYESAMNSEAARTPARAQERRATPYQQLPMGQQPYNPFDEFEQNDFMI